MKQLVLMYMLIFSNCTSFSQMTAGRYREVEDSTENDGFLLLKWNRKFEYSDHTRYNCFGGRHYIRGKWKLKNDTLICTNKFYYEEDDFIIDSLGITSSDSIIITVKNEFKIPLVNVKVNYRYDGSILVNPYFTDSMGQIIISKKVLEPNFTDEYYTKRVGFSIFFPQPVNTTSVSTGLSTKTNLIYITLVENPKKETILRTTYFKKEGEVLRYLRTVTSSDTNIEAYNYWGNILL